VRWSWQPDGHRKRDLGVPLEQSLPIWLAGVRCHRRAVC